jgi:hypothetical protein
MAGATTFYAGGQAVPQSQQSWIYDQFNGTTFQPNAMDVQHEPLYDTYSAIAGSTVPNLTQFFTTPSGKTLNQTNVTTAKRLDAPEAFTVKGIKFHVLENILLADFVTLVNSFCLEFWIGQKYYNRAPLWFYTPGGGIYGFSDVSGASAYTNGMTGRSEAHELAINIVIDNQASFFGQLNGVATVLSGTNVGGTGLTAMMLLDGLHARGVQ